MQAQSSSSTCIPFDIEGYIDEEVSFTLKDAAELNLCDLTKDRLRMMIPHLDVDTADLVRNAGFVREIFNSIKGDLPAMLREALQPAAYIESHEQKFLGAMERLAAREAQKHLPSQEIQHKQSLVEFKDVIDKLTNSFNHVNQEHEILRDEKEQLLAKLKEIEDSIKLKEDNLSKIPSAISEQKILMATKHAELKVVQAKRKKLIPGTSEEDNRQIAEIDAIRQNALNAIESFLNL